MRHNGFSAKSTDVPETVAAGRRPCIASDIEGHLHIVFEEGKEGQSHLYYLQSDNEGKALDPTGRPTRPTRVWLSLPEVAVSKSLDVDAVWSGIKANQAEGAAEIYFSRSSDGGKIFSKPKAIFNCACKSSGPSIAVGTDGSIHIVWCEVSATSDSRQIYYSRSADAGLTWSTKQLLALAHQNEGGGVSSQPTVAASNNGTVHVSWVDLNPGKSAPDIFYAKCENGNWSRPVNVSSSARIAQQPIISCGRGQNVFLTWLDNSRKELAPDIWCSVDNHDSKFSEPFNISDTPGVSSDPAIAADSRGRVVIVWSDTTSGVTKPDIFGRVSLDSLADFSNLIDLSNTEGVSLHPSAAIAGERVFVVWDENQGKVSKVFMKSMRLDRCGHRPHSKSRSADSWEFIYKQIEPGWSPIHTSGWRFSVPGV